MSLRTFWTISVLLCFVIIAGYLIADYHYQKPRVVFMDVGQGDAILFSDHHRQLLIDAGRNERVIKEIARFMAPWDRHIEYALMTHTDSDHIGGFVPLSEYYSFGTVFSGDSRSDTVISATWNTIRIRDHIPTRSITRGDTFTIGQWKFFVLWPVTGILETGETNDRSVVVRAEYGPYSVLAGGDASIIIENWIVDHTPRALLTTTILKLGHHGSRTSTSEKFLRATSPRVAIISAGCNNPYGHPHKRVLSLLEYLSIPYRSTCDEGSIVYTYDLRGK